MTKREKRNAKNSVHVIRVIGILLLILAFLFGLLILIIGMSEQRTLREAQANYTAVSVRITDLQTSAHSKQILIAMLEPVEETTPPQADTPPNGASPDHTPPEADPHRPNQSLLGTTAASTMNRSLTEGEILTMYYDPNNTDMRVVDFKTAGPLLWFGGTLCGGTAAIGLVLLLFCLIRRRPKPAAQIPKKTY